MKKLSFLTAAIWAFGLIIFPQAGLAKMTVMSDQDLRAVTGQAGIAIQTDQFDGLNLAGKSLPSPNQDGFGNDYGNDPLKLLNSMSGDSAKIGSGNYTADTRFITYDKTGFAMSITNMEAEINIDSMTTDIRMGNISMGTIGIKGLNVKVSGDVHIFIRQ